MQGDLVLCLSDVFRYIRIKILMYSLKQNLSDQV